MAARIFTVMAGLLEHAKKKLATPLAQALTLCSLLIEDIIKEIKKSVILYGRAYFHSFTPKTVFHQGAERSCLWAMQFMERLAFPVKPHHGLRIYGPWGRECTVYFFPNQAGSHYNPRCNIGCWKSSRKFLKLKNQWLPKRHHSYSM